MYCGNINDKVLSRNLPCSSVYRDMDDQLNASLSLSENTEPGKFPLQAEPTYGKLQGIRVLNFIVTYGILIGFGKNKKNS